MNPFIPPLQRQVKGKLSHVIRGYFQQQSWFIKEPHAIFYKQTSYWGQSSKGAFLLEALHHKYDNMKQHMEQKHGGDEHITNQTSHCYDVALPSATNNIRKC